MAAGHAHAAQRHDGECRAWRLTLHMSSARTNSANSAGKPDAWIKQYPWTAWCLPQLGGYNPTSQALCGQVGKRPWGYSMVSAGSHAS